MLEDIVHRFVAVFLQYFLELSVCILSSNHISFFMFGTVSDQEMLPCFPVFREVQYSFGYWHCAHATQRNLFAKMRHKENVLSKRRACAGAFRVHAGTEPLKSEKRVKSMFCKNLTTIGHLLSLLNKQTQVQWLKHACTVCVILMYWTIYQVLIKR